MHTTTNFKLFDELLLSADSHQPDVICITESWLGSGIEDSEILIPGYQTLRLDRNRHGGGVLMYVSHKFIVKQSHLIHLLNCLL